ncbi:MAG: cytochrome P450 [Actinobacteria bacterium]|nr:cytochrome P450 [Actinomycetota bacterium]
MPEIDAAVSYPRERVDGFDPPPPLRDAVAGGRPRRLRFPDGHLGWLIGDYADARAVLADRRFSIGVTRQAVGEPAKSEAYDAALGPLRAGAITSLDPPGHTRLRRAVGERLSPAGVERRRPRVESIVAERLDAMEAAGPPADLHAMLADPVPARVICDLLGVPESEQHRFVRPTELLLDPDATAAEVAAAFGGFSDYARLLVEEKRSDPRDDLLSDLLAGGGLSDAEVAGLALELLVTGHETTAGLITMCVLALLEDRSRWDSLRAAGALEDAAIEELLRYVSVVEIGFTRTALEDVAVGEVTIAAGESVAISLLAANRDPARFDEPDGIDLDRGENRHLAFGHGIHKCLGQYLARLELRLALTGLLARFPSLDLAVAPAEVQLSCTDFGVYRAAALPVAW